MHMYVFKVLQILDMRNQGENRGWPNSPETRILSATPHCLYMREDKQI